MPDAGTLFVAVLAGHLAGDWIAQTDHQAANKTTSRRALAAHVATYHAALLACTLPVLHDPARLAILLTVSAATHWYIDQRWPTLLVMRATRSHQLAATTWGVIVTDQALHLLILAALTLTLAG